MRRKFSNASVVMLMTILGKNQGTGYINTEEPVGSEGSEE